MHARGSLALAPGTYGEFARYKPYLFCAGRRREAFAYLSAFWEHLPSAKLSHNNTLLQLQNGTNFWGDVSEGDKIYIRDYWYAAIERKLDEHFSSGGQAMAVLGYEGARTLKLYSAIHSRMHCDTATVKTAVPRSYSN
eukprot:9060-Heterococcus_DN1.PRE.2